MYIPSSARPFTPATPHSASSLVISSTLPPTSDNHVASTGSVSTAAGRFWSAIQSLCGYTKQDIYDDHEEATMSILTKRQSAQATNVTIAVVVAVFLTLFVVCVIAFMYRYRYSIRIRGGRKKRRHRRRRRGGSKSSKSFKSSSDSAPPTPGDGAPGPSEPPPAA